MLYYALCLSYHSNTEAVLFACLSSGLAMSSLLGPKVGNSFNSMEAWSYTISSPPERGSGGEALSRRRQRSLHSWFGGIYYQNIHFWHVSAEILP